MFGIHTLDYFFIIGNHLGQITLVFIEIDNSLAIDSFLLKARLPTSNGSDYLLIDEPNVIEKVSIILGKL